MTPFRTFKILAPLFLGAIVTALPVHAASPAQCKTLSKKTCSANPGCTWVDGYVRKDGRKVKAYCRKVSRKASKDPVGSGSKKLGAKARKKAKVPAGTR
ncbi:hypothetical protein [endosymbiont of unidentified scaly snail isolate Monju]|uniref:hypothetical protein n=1 Tax=endosymbiont of unidentified scaly snail isolate Monju TaxID=1248727 RepID=UPI00068DCE66|nr:hypothetical protein [endosymbiont of unidentified scaly snail isolate Monju]